MIQTSTPVAIEVINSSAWIDILQIVASLLLGIAAILVAYQANKLNKRAIEHDIKMKQTEINIALFKERYSILQLFTVDINEIDFFDQAKNDVNAIRVSTLMQKIPFIFTNDTADILRKMMLEIIDVLIEKKEFPQYNNEELSPKLRAFIELERTERGKRKLVFVNQLADNALRILEKYKLDL